jgi:PhzF family phenazine biosynthesis protein
MQLFIVDAFTDSIFSGNQAGVVLLGDDQPFPDDTLMQKIAAELKHSETAFVKRVGSDFFQLRYFTPEGEVPLCGHATISAFTVLRNKGEITCGNASAQTNSGNLRVKVETDIIWLEMPKGELIRPLMQEESYRFYRAYGLNDSDRSNSMLPAIVKVGLADVLLPVNSKTALDHAVQNRDEVSALSKDLSVVGVHMFYCPENAQITAYCRNFAPLFGIDEEAATGTSNASLTYYLQQKNRIKVNTIHTFIQGEAMGKPSVIMSRIDADGTIHIGGNAVISIEAKLTI